MMATQTLGIYKDTTHHVKTFEEIHHDCKLDVLPKTLKLGKDKPSAARLCFSMLSVCRQLYEEANNILWATNTYSFAEPEPFRVFIDGLNPAQKRNMVRVSMSVKMLEAAFESSATFRPENDLHRWRLGHGDSKYISGLRGVKQLNIYVTFTPLSPKHRRKKGHRKNFEAKADPIRVMMQELFGLSLLSPEHFSLKISDNDVVFEQFNINGEKLTVDEKELLCTDLNKAILDPKTAESVKEKDRKRHEAFIARLSAKAPELAEEARIKAGKYRNSIKEMEMKATTLEEILNGPDSEDLSRYKAHLTKRSMLDIKWGDKADRRNVANLIHHCKRAAIGYTKMAEKEEQKAAMRHARALKLNVTYRQRFEDRQH